MGESKSLLREEEMEGMDQGRGACDTPQVAEGVVDGPFPLLDGVGHPFGEGVERAEEQSCSVGTLFQVPRGPALSETIVAPNHISYSL